MLQESQIAVEGAQEVTDGRWPFQGVADQLVVDCLHPAWETRHGAALALREILTCQAASAAVVGPVDDSPTGGCPHRAICAQLPGTSSVGWLEQMA